jgi:hypothetical protein
LALFRKSLLVLSLLALQLLLPSVTISVARTISWSGYLWDVRPPATAQGPGPNNWYDSPANVQVQGSDLLLSIVKDPSGQWTSSEVDNEQHLGYGTYRWVVASDLSALDANDVLGMFTYGGSDPSKNEIDIEPSHWGNMSWPTGSATVWQDANSNLSVVRDFGYSARPPYVNQFTWSPGRIDYLIADATGATLLAWTLTSGVPTPSTEVPVINYWRFNNGAPAAVRTMRISSFAWAPLGQTLPPRGNPQPPAAAGPSVAGGSSSRAGTAGAPLLQHGPLALACVVRARPGSTSSRRSRDPVHVDLTMPRDRFAMAGFPHDAVLRWSATGAASLELVIRRWVGGAGFVRVGALPRSVRLGTGRMHLPGRVAGRRLGRGVYSISVIEGARCTPGRSGFTIT